MMIIGCDFHPSFQQIAYVEQETGEYEERRLSHREEAAAFYRSLAGRAVRIGVEATGNDSWFHKLMSELGYELLVGDASAIHASAPREQRTDKRDARHILRWLMENRFPAIWQPPVANVEQRQLLLHRCRLVRMRTRIKNQLDSMAKNEGLTGSRAWSAKRRQQIKALPLTGWYTARRADLLGLLDELEKRIKPLDEAVQAAAEQNAEAQLLMTHPGRRSGGIAGLRADHGGLEAIPPRQAGGQLSGADSVRGIQRQASAADGTHHQAGQYAAALASGGSCRQSIEQGSELAPAVFASIDEQASRRGQSGYRPQTGGSFVLDVALRAELHTDHGARFARGAVHYGQWVRLQAEKLIGRPASVAR
jgi:transposase